MTHRLLPGRNDRSTKERAQAAARDVHLHRKYGHVRSGIGESRCALRSCTYFRGRRTTTSLSLSLLLSLLLIPSRSRACFARSRLYLERSNRHDERVTRDSPRFKRNNRSSFVPKVYTRNARGIRGHVEAYVAAFDKHWNLALEDCFEVWTRKVKRKAPALGNFFLFFFSFLSFCFSSFSSFVDSAIPSHLDRAALIERRN